MRKIYNKSNCLDNQLVLIDSLHFLNGSLDNLAKKLGKNDCHHVSQEFNAYILDLVKQKVFYPYEYMDSFKKLKEILPRKDKFYSLFCSSLVMESVIKKI